MDAQNSLPTSECLQWFGETDRGKVRANNEDAFLGVQFDAQEVHYLGKYGAGSTRKLDFVFAVSDGMGGAQAGELEERWHLAAFQVSLFSRYATRMVAFQTKTEALEQSPAIDKGALAESASQN